MEPLLRFQPPIIAHRGASALAPENTIAAFTKAAQLGIKWVEFDVMLAACGEAVVFHDEELTRTTNGTGQLGDYPYSYLQTLDAGAWFDPMFSDERIPTLSQVLDFICSAQLSANIEIKPLPGHERQTCLTVLQSVQRIFKDPNQSILFSSFSLPALEALRVLSKDCLIGLLMHEWLPDWEVICDDLNCVSVHVNEESISMDRARKIKNTGRLLLCYTVNDPLRAKELYSWGVDAVFSDVPPAMLI